MKSIPTIERRIEHLKRQAEAMRQEEVRPILQFIREAVKVYDIRASDIYPVMTVAEYEARHNPHTAKSNGHAKKVMTKPRTGRTPRAAKYSDGVNYWSGLGRRPDWVRKAIKAGHSLEEFKL